MKRLRRKPAKYLGVAGLLALFVVYCAPPLLSAPDASAGRYNGVLPPWSLGPTAKIGGVLDRIRPRRPARTPAPAQSQIPAGTAVQFDGLDDRVTFGPAPALGATTFTIETWFRRDGASSTATTGGGFTAVPLLTKGTGETDGDNRDVNYFLGIDAKRRVLVTDFEDMATGANHPAFGVTPISDFVWYHAAATYDGTTWRLYLNGALETQLVVGAYTPRFDSIQHAGLGTSLNSSGNASGTFLGALDEARIWNVARSAADIQSTMAEPVPAAPGLIGRWGLDEGVGLSALDSSGSGVVGTLRNGAAWTTGTPFVSTPAPPGAYGLRLKGTASAADYVSLGQATNLGAQAFTVETWFRREGVGVGTVTDGLTGVVPLAAVVPLVAKGRLGTDASTQDLNYFLGIRQTDNLLVADFEDTATGANHVVAGLTPVLANSVWRHVAATYDGTTWRLYLDGVLDQQQFIGSFTPQFNSVSPASIGTTLTSAGVAAGFFTGTVDETRIWNYARTAAQIAGAKDRQIASASGLLGRWGFDQCCTALDSSGQNVTGTVFGSGWTWVGVAGAPMTAPVNLAPVVAAGADQSIAVPASALLSGLVTDDNRSSGEVSTAWSKTSGPGTVTFGTPGALTTTASFSTGGTYVLTLTASDGELSGSDSVTVLVDGGAPNVAPVVNAGLDQITTVPTGASLTGLVTDDGKPGGAPSLLWSKVSGPGTVTFGQAAAAITTASFSLPGTYVVMLTANDGLLAGSDTVTIQVNAVNVAPVVNAGSDRTVVLPSPASLTGTVSDDGLPAGTTTTLWSKVSGPGTVVFAQAAAVSTTATFSAAGSYVLMLTANDGALVNSDTLIVTVDEQSAAANNGIDLNGGMTYVTFGQAPGLGASTFTIEAWFRRDGMGSGASTGSGGIASAIPLVTKGRGESDTGNLNMNYFLGIDRDSNVLVADFEEGVGGTTSGLNHPVSGVTVIQNNTWYHAAATYDGSKWQLFLNGVLERELAVNQPARSDSIQHAAIGSALNSSGAPEGFFDGAIDEVRIWNVARTPQQIAAGVSIEIPSDPNLLGRWGLNETSGNIVNDSTGRGNTGTIVGGGWVWGQGAPFDIVPNNAPDVPVLISPSGSTAPSPATLNVSVSDSDGDPMTVTFYGRAKGITAPDFTVVAIPDTQHYVDDPGRAATFTTQTNWIVNNRAPLNIVFASHLGDITEHQDQFIVEWQRADTSLRVLEANGVPFGMSPGNHDQYPSGVANFYDQFFPPSRFLGLPWYGGYLGAEAGDPNRLNKDNYELFSAGGLDFLAIHIETDWPSYAVTWADKIIKRYPNRRVILSTHAFLNTSSVRPTATQFGRTDGSMSAEAVWQQLIRPNCNVFMVINGHYPGEGRRTDLNNCGQPVHQVLTDYQSLANGGDGWLRYYTFKPSENKIYAYTYSPTRNGGAGQFDTKASSQFSLDYAMQGAAFTVIGTNAGVTSGSNTTTAWSGLLPGSEYEWYATVNDGKVTTTGPVWSFTASSGSNSPPVAVNNAYTVAEDATLTVTGTGVLGNDTDADDNNLTAILVQGASHGTLTLSPFGSFVYTPVRELQRPRQLHLQGQRRQRRLQRRDGFDHGHRRQRCSGGEQRQLQRGRGCGPDRQRSRCPGQRQRSGREHPDGGARPRADARRPGAERRRHVHVHAGSELQRS